MAATIRDQEVSIGFLMEFSCGDHAARIAGP
jgi:hypothetical protein